jgi:hypothetical protein
MPRCFLGLSNSSNPGRETLFYRWHYPLFMWKVGLAPGEAVECPNGSAAIRRAHAVILKTVGEVPEDFTASLTA